MLDTSLLEGYLGQLPKSVIEQMLTLYTEQAQQYLQDIKSAASQLDQELWRQHCHKMKGAASSVGFVELQQQLAQAEAVNVSEDQSARLSLFEQLNEQSIVQFQQWLATH